MDKKVDLFLPQVSSSWSCTLHVHMYVMTRQEVDTVKTCNYCGAVWLIIYLFTGKNL